MTMNHDSATDIRRRITQKNGGIGGRASVLRSTDRPVSSPVRWLAYLALALAAAWTVVYAVPAFGGLLVASALGLGAFVAVPWAVISLGVRMAERAE